MSKKDALALRRLLAAGLSFFAIPASARAQRFKRFLKTAQLGCWHVPAKLR